MDMLRQQIQDLTQQVNSGRSQKQSSLKDICPYPFDRHMIMPPFPCNFKTLKFDKYKGKGDPTDYVREFYTACLEVAYEETYLMHLFPQSLGGSAIQWFSHFPRRIRTFEDLFQKFITHHAHNIERDVSMVDLCNTKQKNGELFSTLLHIWKHLSSRHSFPILEEQLVEIFISNLNEEMEFYLDIKCLDTFKDVITKGLKIKKSLIKKRLVKIYKDNKDGPQPTYNSDKPKFWAKNKNFVKDGVVHERTIKIAQTIVKIVGQANNHNNPTTNQANPSNNQGNQTPNTQQEAPKK